MATSSSMLCGELWAITWKEQIFLVWKLKVNYLDIFGGKKKKKNQSVLLKDFEYLYMRKCFQFISF